MVDTIAQEDRDDPAKDGLIRLARDQFFAMLMSNRRPVAFVGSGLSLIYGGVTWDEAVDIILDDGLLELDEAIKVASTPVRTQLLKRMKAMILAQRERGETSLNAADKYVALKLAEDAFRLCAEGKTPAQKRDAPTVQKKFAELARDNSKAIFQIDARRFLGYEKGYPNSTFNERRSKIEKFIDILDKLIANDGKQTGPDYGVQIFRDIVYDLQFLEGALSHIGAHSSVIDIIHRLRCCETALEGPLPIDKRSMLAPIFASLSQDQRNKLLKFIQLKISDPDKWNRQPPARPLLDPLRHLHELFGITRYITINYDFEVENLVMVSDYASSEPPPNDRKMYGLDSAIADGRLAREPEDFGVTRRLPDGRFMRSDIYRPGSAAQLFELGLNSPDHSFHILHLHGRADDPKSMVTKDDDVNRQYRRSSSFVGSLNQALDLALTANPVLFVGTGMSEAEITRGLRQMVSEIDRDPDSMAFQLAASEKEGPEPWRRAVAQYLQYGVRVLPFGDGDRGEGSSLAKHLDEISNARNFVEQLIAYIEKGGQKPKPPKLPGSSRGLYRLYIFGEDHVLDWAIENAKDILNRRKTILKTKKSKINFLHGCIDFLFYLKSKLISASFVHELDFLSKDLQRQRNRVRAAIDARDDGVFARSAGEMDTRIRHLSSQPSGPSRHLLRPILLYPLTRLHILSSGLGKGTHFRSLFTQYKKHELSVHICALGFSHGAEVDSAITILRDFLQRRVPHYAAPTACNGEQLKGLRRDRLDGIKVLLQAVGDAKPEKPAVLMMVGLERLFDDDGRPLSPDMEELLEHLLDRDADADLRVELFATPAIIPWLERCWKKILARHDRDFKWASHPALGGEWSGRELILDLRMQPENGANPVIRKIYPTDGLAGKLEQSIQTAIKEYENCPWFPPFLSQRFDAARIPRPGAGNQRTHHLVRLALDYWSSLVPMPDSDRWGPDFNRERLANLDLAILWTLSAIGAPTSASVLKHSHRVRDALEAAGRDLDASDSDIVERMDSLVSFGLVVNLPATLGDGTIYALHRAVLNAIRDLHGIPMGDGLLSNSFSLSLAASLSTDVLVPEEDVRTELKKMTGRFLAAWKDTKLPSKLLASLVEFEIGKSLESCNSGIVEQQRTVRRAAAMLATGMSEPLRASANILRGFFSVAALVTVDTQPSEDPNGLGEYESHKRRLGKLFSVIREASAAMKEGQEAANKLDEFAKPPETLIKPEFDKIISDAETAGRSNVRPLYGGELIWLHNERAVLSLIQGDLYEARFSFGQAMRALEEHKGSGRGNFRRRIEINRSLLLAERGRIAEAMTDLERLCLEHAKDDRHESRLIHGLSLGYLGMCRHLQGHLINADKEYTRGLRILRSLDAQRAQALFHMRRAALCVRLGRQEDAAADIQLAIVMAEAGRQMDVLWRARVAAIAIIQERGRAARTVLHQALEFGERLANHRIRLDAQVQLGNLFDREDNPEQAAIHYAEAMKMAVRYGFNLKRTGLRISMGRAMVKQGNKTGLYLIHRGIRLAERSGYQAAVERGEQSLLELEKFSLVTAKDIMKYRE